MTIKTGHPQELEVQALLSNIKVYAHLEQLRYVTAKSVIASEVEAHKKYVEETKDKLVAIERKIYEALDGAMKEGIDIGKASPYD